MQQPTIGVIGAGPIGGILAAHLAHCGAHVHLVDVAQPILDAVGKQGLVVSGEVNMKSPVAGLHRDVADLHAIQPEYVFIATKTTVMDFFMDALMAFDPVITTLVHLQNGIDPEEVTAQQYPRDRVLRVVVHYAGKATAAGQYRMNFFHRPNYIGGLEPRAKGISQRVAALMTQARLDTDATDDIKREAWHKSILNCAIMPASVITGMMMGTIMNTPATRRVVGLTFKEILEVAAYKGYRFEEDFFDRGMDYLTRAGAHRTSMLEDFQAGLPLELAFLNGRVLTHASRSGIECPMNRCQVDLISGMVMQRDGV